MGKSYTWTINKSVSVGVDKEKLVEDGLFEKYSKESVTYKIQPKKIKEGK